MTDFPFRLFKDGREIVFPIGSKRFVSCETRQIPGDGAVESTIYGTAVFTGDPAFRRHEVSLSCSDQTVAPIADLWPGERVTLYSPTEMSVSGSLVTLPYDPVPGSVYGVNRDDEIVGRPVGTGRQVSVPGATSIRFKPIMRCMITARSFNAVERRGIAGWQIDMRDADGFSGGDDEDESLKIWLEPQIFSSMNVGDYLSLDFTGLTQSNEGGLVFTYEIEPGSVLPPGASMLTTAVEGELTTPGFYPFVVRVSALNASATQTFAVHVLEEGQSVFVPPAATGGTIRDFLDYDTDLQTRSHTFLSSGVLDVTRPGWAEVFIVSGGGGSGWAGAGGAGGVPMHGRPFSVYLRPGSYPVVVGAGGARGAQSTTGRHGRRGSVSRFYGIEPTGGGGGAGFQNSTSGLQSDGASGGGGSRPTDQNNAYTHGPGDGKDGQGFSGAASYANSGNAGGGGGGAAGPGTPRDGGPGYNYFLDDTPRMCGGGGPGYTSRSGPDGQSGVGIGRHGATSGHAQANTGAGGAGGELGGNGGSGIVIIRYRRA